MHRSRRFWLLYAAAWLPYGSLYTALFVVDNGVSLPRALRDTGINLSTAALLGAGVVLLCDRLRWPPRRPALFAAVHVACALAYSCAWFASLMLGLSITTSLRAGRWFPVWFNGAAQHWQLFAGVMAYGTIAGISYAVQAGALFREQEARAARAEVLRARAEIQALRAQLNPHFLFNTLHSLMALVRHEPASAEDALERFAGLLRYTLHAKRNEVDDVPLADEWDFVRDYLALERIRLGARLRVEEEVDEDALDCTVPAFALQPLVENAIRHAVAPRARGGCIRIVIARADDALRIAVHDDGPGADPAALDGAPGLGLRVIRQRLETRYGGAAVMTVRTAPGEGFSAEMRIPVAARTPAREAAWSFAH
ncbi:MAG TPA: histidine kinase [Longimicrobium sp.]|jgi:signal transduction histidine kinase|uniref:sensor histidine kinase n=1 Tax=Longimicrobium sp. TaxID=2029185 RepID=UPI002ED91758